jgi:hypothetical protein
MPARHWTHLPPRELLTRAPFPQLLYRILVLHACLVVSFVTFLCSSDVPSPKFSTAASRHKQMPASFTNLETPLQKEVDGAPIASDLSCRVGGLLNEYLIKRVRYWLPTEHSFSVHASLSCDHSCMLP